MYLHVGSMKSVRSQNIIGIFNLDAERTASTMSSFLKNAEKNRCVESADEKELPKSFILLQTGSQSGIQKKTKQKVNDHIVLSPISSVTLSARIRDSIM